MWGGGAEPQLPLLLTPWPPCPPLADFWAENRMNCGTKKAPLPTVDMWDTDGPGYGLNGSWACNQTAQAGCTYQVRSWEDRWRTLTMHDGC